MEKVLFAVDELTGLIGAAALMRPSKSVQDMELSSLKKKFKDKRFAAGCSRETIQQGAELLGWELSELLERTLQAMKATEADIEASARRCRRVTKAALAAFVRRPHSGRASFSCEKVSPSAMRRVISEAHVPGNDGFSFYSVICG